MGGAEETFVLLVIDLEHTGHGPYSSDILQIGAVGALFTMLAEAPANVISSYDGQVLFDFNMDIRTDQLLNKNLDVVFHRNFPRQKIRDASPFLEVMSAFRSEVLTLKSGLPPNTKLLIAAHNGYVSDFSVLHCQFQRHGQSFAEFLTSMDVEGFVDTLVIARELNLPTKLSDLYKRLTGIELSNAHDAGADADAALTLFESAPFRSMYSDSSKSIGRKTVPLIQYIESQKAHRDQEKAPIVVPTSTFESKEDHLDQNAAETEDGLTLLASDNEEPEAAAEDSEDEPGSGSDDDYKVPLGQSSAAAENENFTDVTGILENKETFNQGWKPDLEFKVRDVGPVGFNGDEDEVVIFRRLMGGDRHFEEQKQYTNLYAKQHKRARWKDAERDELDALIGVLLYMGRKHTTRADAFRESPWGDDFVKKIFSCRRFTDLMSCLHFVDNDAVNAQSRRADVYWQVRPVINRINDAIEQAYIPEQYCCVDEKRYGYIAVHNNFIKYLYVLLPV